MPIRTNRGRAAVYRKLWGWPLRSPRHLATVGLFLLAIVLFLGYILPRMVGDSRAAQPPAQSTSVAPPPSTATTPSQGAQGVIPPPPSSPPPTRLSPSDNKTPAKADQAALDVAKKWAAAFVKHDGVTASQWLDGLRPFTTDEYLGASLSKIDPKAVTQSKVTGDPVATPDSYVSSLTVDVPTDDKKLHLTLVKTADGWRVNEHDEVG
ncbi:hypothetical protein [Actinocrispum wychmicini]|uniref:Uncharacterized protein n=1 Tax=Actinocrispum wychmicini TaxID=1213861 RepID=A0A4R2JI06_9PSEU|nr:hypothetical protein [Actinocrispum wychmicini]TCO58714.1 hypothetical protein EV192_105786 [Actinocrispum wychmicini]